MPHLYVVSFKEHSFNKKLIINSDHKLEESEIRALKEKHGYVKDFLNEADKQNKRIVSIDWKDLHIVPIAISSKEPPSEISIAEIAIADLKQLRSPAFSTRLENLLDAKPADIPVVKFAWKLLIGPLLFVSRFLSKNRNKALRSLKDLDNSFSYNNSQDYFSDYHKHLGSIIANLDTEKSEKLSELKKHLEEMQSNGLLIQKAIEGQRTSLDQTSHALAQHAWEKFSQAKADLDTHLLTFPTGFYENGKFQPLLATFFVDHDKKIRLELESLGTSKIRDLQQIYRFDAPSQMSLMETINGLLLLSTQEKASKPVKLSHREKIRIKVARQFNVDSSIEDNTNKKTSRFVSSRWLHEKIITSGGAPLKKQTQSIDRTLTGIVGADLAHFFPEVPTHEKIELIIKLFEEHYRKFFEAQPYLTSAQQEKELQLLKLKVKRLENYLIKHLGKEEFDNLKSTNQVFNLFFKKMEQLEAVYIPIKNKHIERKSSEIDRAFKKGSGSYSFYVKGLESLSSPAISKKTKAKKISSISKAEISELKENILNHHVSSSISSLTSIQKKIDRLVDKKNYLQAKEFSIQVLQIIPIPTDDPNNFWQIASSSEVDALIRQINDLNKHIWESSLRLKDKAPSHEQLLQMIKSQVITAKVGNVSLDQVDLLNVLLLHPHYRFGWLPDQQAEAIQIIEYLKSINQPPLRYDLREKAKLKFSKKETDQFKVAQARLQFMTACLMKPDYTLYPYFGTGKASEAMGINYLDWLVKEAVNRGAKTPQEKSEMIKMIKFEAVQKDLDSLGRLDFSSKEYVSKAQGIKIHDKSLLSKNAISYVPYLWEVLGGDYEKKYQFQNDQSNTKDLVGPLRGEETYLAGKDEQTIAFYTVKGKTKGYNILFKEDDATLTPQKGYTEPTLLAFNLQKDPRGQFSQVDNYNFDAAQVTIENQLSYQSVYESLNLLRTQPYLLNDTEFQRTIWHNISRPGFIAQAIKANPLFFENLAPDLQALIQEHPQATPFLVMLGGILSVHIQELKIPEFEHLALSFPSLNTQLTIGDTTKSVHTWLNDWLRDSENPAAVSAALLFLFYKQPTETASPNDLALLIHAATIFETTGSLTGIPQFNTEILKWIKEGVIPQISLRGEKDNNFLNHFFDEWVRLSTNNPAYSCMNWKADKEHRYKNKDFIIDLPNLHIQSQKKVQPFEGQHVPLPFPVARSVTHLFEHPIKATVRKGASPSEAYYEFSHNDRDYSIYYNQETGKTDVYAKIPVNLKKPMGKKEWFQYSPQMSTDEQELSAIEQLITKNGLWINPKRPKQAYLFPQTSDKELNEKAFKVALNKKGKIVSVQDPISKSYVVLDKRKHLSQVTSFADPNQTLFLSRSPKGNITEIRFIHEHSSLKKKRRGEWIYHNDKLGEGYKWLTDLSEGQLLLKERSSAKAFLDSFDGMHEKFILPVSNGKVHTFIINPYPMIRHKGIEKIEFDYSGNVLSENMPPLTITFDEQGKQEGNPTAFLYLAYYFAHIKNFKMAEHYLNLAKKAPNASDTKAQVLTKLEELFQKEIPSSARTAAFYLKAQLAIKSIRTIQLSQTLYNPVESAEFLNNMLHIAKLYHTYESREADLIVGGLTEEELFEIKRYAQTSMVSYLKNYQENLLSTEPTISINYSQFEYFPPKSEPKSTDVLTMLLMADLKKQLPLEKLLEGKVLTADHMIRQFFHLITAILEARDNPQDLEKIKLFLRSPKEWEMHDTQESPENIQMANFATQYLEILLSKPTSSIEANAVRKKAIQLRSELPYFARNLGVISTLYDTLTEKLGDVASTQNKIKRFLNDLVKDVVIPPPKDVKGTYDEGEGKHITSLQSVLNVLAEKPESMTSLEQSEINRMIHEGDFDLEKPRELLSLLRDSEAKGFSVLEIRNETEMLRQIHELEHEIANRPQINPTALPQLDPGTIPSQFELFRDMFPSKFADQNVALKAKLEGLDTKAKRLQTYLDKPHVKATHQEEYRQLSMGLEIAKEKIRTEMLLKTEFSKAEIQNFKKVVSEQTLALGKLEYTARKKLLDHIKSSKSLPNSIKEMVNHPEIYTEYELLNEVFKVYKKVGTTKTLAEFDQEITSYLFLSAAYQQFKKSKGLLESESSASNAAKALQSIHSALNSQRFTDAGISNGLISRICLVAEARDGIIFRKSQLQTIQEFSDNPNLWKSLIMGEGKTSYITPAIAEILSELDHFVIITGPQNLIKGNRQTFDKASRTLLDQASLEFTIPLTEHLPHNLLAEKYIQLLKAVKNKGYVVTSVEELCSLHNLIIQLENEKLQLFENSPENEFKIFFVEKRLHYLRKISQLLHGEAEHLKIKTQFFGDEVDATHDISHHVNLAMGNVSSPNKAVRDVARNLCEMILNTESSSPLNNLKTSLLHDSQSVTTKEEMRTFMLNTAKEIQKNPKFLQLIGPEQAANLAKIHPDEWANYLTGLSNKRPPLLPQWNDQDPSLKYIAGAKQLLTHTIPGMLSIKSGNDYGFSDFNGFLNVPKTSKNESEGMRFGDEFELIFAQYLGYIEYLPAQSLTNQSEIFLTKALKTFHNKFPTLYDHLIEDFSASQKDLPDEKRLTLTDYFKTPEAWKHRVALLDEIVFDGGYITRFNQQITTNVQEIFHGKNMGGITGTLDPYTLPYISDEVQFNQIQGANKTSTREVEAETLLRMTLNLPDGIDTQVSIYDDLDPMTHLREKILKNPQSKAFVNNSGASSEGLDMLAWVRKLKNTPEGTSKTYLFRHPKFEVTYIWPPHAQEPVRYKGQPLSTDCVTLYGPNDTRGVDQPIGTGDVHFFIGATTSLQEYMQTLFRPRRIGTDHKVILHIPKTWAEQIKPTDPSKGITYGDVALYIIDRTADNKESVNEAAQLEKVFGQLKTVVSKYLRQTNPKFDSLEFWDKKNLAEFGLYASEESSIFTAVRDLYIKNKEIEFADLYEPVEKISGTQKVLNTYQDFGKAIDAILDKLPNTHLEGKTNLAKDLIDLKQHAIEQKKHMEQIIKEHEKFLPAETIKTGNSGKGVKEQVKELQQEKTKTKQVVEAPLEKITIPQKLKRKYKPLDLDALFTSTTSPGNPSTLEPPFSNYFISLEAQEILKQLGHHRGDLVLYLAMAKIGENSYKMTLVSKQDYHKVIVPHLDNKELGQKELYVFSPTSKGFSQINGTSKYHGLLPNETIAFKCYLGVKEYNTDEISRLKKWLNSLNATELDHLKLFLKEKTTQTLYDLVQDLM